MIELEREEDSLNEWLHRSLEAEAALTSPLPPNSPSRQTVLALEDQIIQSLESYASEISVGLSENIIWSYATQPYPLRDDDMETSVSNLTMAGFWRGTAAAAAILLSFISIS